MLKIINKEHYNKVTAEARARGIYSKLKIQLEYLRNYGCSDEKPDNAVVELGYDFASMSFSVVFLFKQKDGGYKFFMNGGLVFHEHDQDWSVHT